ncbi:hypothetical protein TVAG_021550 [Trichomonas vaginalis G3]|uniref:Bromo domain-containing protein n=1 Tax=Trichomonas vaginalis (strain ATCC PRA-98 / G3) TaxID=412133 RepID=A2DHD5_TRIV3|nr:histone, subunit A domain-containing protein [Trichomonas vaginalis G3]EAY20208.1 hypothetical protein TVAG_021550 [Trichomonas vaginalis G3]KAI5507703.1 histone, subunit A domain-containing protein [Trichomonas vaginalis G3]|eukprot:XP_001581194.1 hypothetical protein [Trichomonas vaginalis G3]
MHSEGTSMKSLGVQQCVLTKLKEFTQDEYENYINKKDLQSFWEGIDELPIEKAMELRRLQLEIPTSSKDFAGGFLSPSLQNFFLLKHKIPEKSTSQVSKPKKVLNIDELIDFLKGSQQWKQSGENWLCGNAEFSTESLFSICTKFINDGNPWEDCPSLSQTYNEACEFLKSRPETEDFTQVHRKMHELRYYTHTDLKTDIEKITGKNSDLKLSTLKEPRTLTDTLRKMMNTVGSSDDGSQEETNERQIHIPDWYIPRLTPLESADCPISEQKPFKITQSIVSARAGISDSQFEQGSLSELLFTTDEGTIAPLPFTSTHAEIPPRKTNTFIRDSTRKYVAQILMDMKYEKASEAGVEILTDIILEQLRHIAQHAAAKTRSGKSSGKFATAAVSQSLRQMGQGLNAPGQH